MTESVLYNLLLQYRRLLLQWEEAINRDPVCEDELRRIDHDMQQFKEDIQRAAAAAGA